MSKTKVNVSILKEHEHGKFLHDVAGVGELLYSVGVSSIGSSYYDVYTEFGFSSVEDVKEHLKEMSNLEVMNITIK